MLEFAGEGGSIRLRCCAVWSCRWKVEVVLMLVEIAPGTKEHFTISEDANSGVKLKTLPHHA